MKEAREAVDTFVNGSDFWRQWSVQDHFANFSRDAFDEDIFKVQTSKRHELVNHLEHLDEEVNKIVGMLDEYHQTIHPVDHPSDKCGACGGSMPWRLRAAR